MSSAFKTLTYWIAFILKSRTWLTKPVRRGREGEEERRGGGRGREESKNLL